MIRIGAPLLCLAVASCAAPAPTLGDARAHAYEGDRAAALRAVEQVILVGPSAEAYRLRGRLRLVEGRARGALEDARRALALDPFDGESHCLMAEALLDAGDLEAAVAAASCAIRY